MNIQFFDCPNCGKSLRVGARACHHCHAVDENDWQDPYAADEQAEGGYAEDEDGVGEQSKGGFARWQRIGFVTIAILLILSFLLQSFLIRPPELQPPW